MQYEFAKKKRPIHNAVSKKTIYQVLSTQTVATQPNRPTLSRMQKDLMASRAIVLFGSWYLTGTKQFRQTILVGKK